MASDKSAINSIRNLFKCFGYYESSNSSNHYYYIEKVPGDHHQESGVKKNCIEDSSSSDHPQKKNPEVIINGAKTRTENYSIVTGENRQVSFSSSKVAVLEIHSRGGVRTMAKPVKERINRAAPGKPHRSIEK